MNDIINTDAPEWAKDRISAIRNGLAEIHRNAVAVAKAYTEARSKDPEFDDWLLEAVPMLTRRTLRWLEQIGNGTMDERFILGQVPADHVLRLEKLPIEDQRRALDGKLPLLTADGSHLQMSLSAMTPDQVAQVIGRDRIRTLEEQRAWIEDRRSKAAEADARAKIGKADAADPFEVDPRRRKLIVRQPMEFTAQQLAGILARMG